MADPAVAPAMSSADRSELARRASDGFGPPVGASGYLVVNNTTRGTIVASRAVPARSYVARLRGLLFKPPLGPGQALLLEPCASIHTLGMRYSIDVLFLDRAGLVVGSYEHVRPNRLFAGSWGARIALELPAGAIAASATQPGDILGFAGR